MFLRPYQGNAPAFRTGAVYIKERLNAACGLSTADSVQASFHLAERILCGFDHRLDQGKNRVELLIREKLQFVNNVSDFCGI